MSVIVQSISTTLDYFTPPADGSKPWLMHDADPRTGVRAKNWVQASIPTNVENVRGKEDQYTLEKAGFEFHKAPSEMRAEDFDNENTIREVYYKESGELYRKLTGGTRVFIFDHTIRRNFPGRKSDTPDTRIPALNVHVDQTPEATVARIHRHMPPEDVPKLLNSRYQIINLWRPIRNPAYDRPLALCDFRSVDLKRDCVAQTLKYPDRDGEIWAVKHHETHRWKYWKGMTPEEIILIKCMDSITDGSVALCTPHTSFEDPSAPKDAKPRESIELRALVFYDA